MTILNLIDEIAKVNPETGGEPESRRAVFKKLAGVAKKAAAGAIPLALGTASHQAYGQTAAQMLDALYLALKLEYLQDEFYRQGLAIPGLIPAADRTVFTQIGKHETAHVKFLEDTIKAMGAPIGKPAFDFSGKGAYPDWNSNYQEFLIIAQGFEDLAVRAYKGLAGSLTGNKAILTAVLQIHSTEARHAAMVRNLRGERGWIPDANGGGAYAPIYAGEDNLKQGFITNVASQAGVSATAATEAFDEPLDSLQVTAITDMFSA
jgi:hypothetical protein